MEPVTKKPRLDQRDSVFCEDSVQHIDIDDNGRLSQICEKKSEVGSTPTTNSSSPDGLMFCEEMVEHTDIVNDERASQIREKESKVENTPSTNSSSSDGLMSQKASDSNKSSSKPAELLFKTFFSLTDKKPKNTLWKEFGPSQYQKWGLLAKIKENSRTLRELTNVTLNNISNSKETFVNILAELEIDYSIVQLKSLKPEKIPYVFAFDVQSTPKYSFFGYGDTEDIAIHIAAKKGLEFFVASCQ